MNWVLLGLAIVLFATWIVLRAVFGFDEGVFNMLWMIAVMFVLLWGAQWCTD
jgi:hypothetical protein